MARDVPLPLQLRVGVHSGPVVAGVLGRSRFSYDLWGDTVNIGSRMESQGVPGAVQVSATAAASLDNGLVRERAGVIDVRGVGPMETFLVRPERRPSAMTVSATLMPGRASIADRTPALAGQAVGVG